MPAAGQESCVQNCLGHSRPIHPSWSRGASLALPKLGSLWHFSPSPHCFHGVNGPPTFETSAGSHSPASSKWPQQSRVTGPRGDFADVLRSTAFIPLDSGGRRGRRTPSTPASLAAVSLPSCSRCSRLCLGEERLLSCLPRLSHRRLIKPGTSALLSPTGFPLAWPAAQTVTKMA